MFALLLNGFNFKGVEYLGVQMDEYTTYASINIVVIKFVILSSTMNDTHLPFHSPKSFPIFRYANLILNFLFRPMYSEM